MWGLDQIDPRIAITAMQGMNASVRNFVFAPIFFGTPILCIATAMLLYRSSQNAAARRAALAGMIYLCFGMGITLLINVPMNQILALVEVPKTIEDAQTIWNNYSPKWQFWNTARTIASGLSLLLLVNATMLMR